VSIGAMYSSRWSRVLMAIITAAILPLMAPIRCICSDRNCIMLNHTKITQP